MVGMSDEIQWANTITESLTRATKRQVRDAMLAILYASFLAGHRAAEEGKRASIAELHRALGRDDESLWKESYVQALVIYSTGFHRGMAVLIDAAEAAEK